MVDRLQPAGPVKIEAVLTAVPTKPMTTSQADKDEIRDITIIGAGPVGLSAAFWAGMRQASSRIIDSLPEIGGQCTTLYPEKWIFDVPGHPRILAKDLVAKLREQALEQFDVPVHLETTSQEISWEPDPSDPERNIVVLHTDHGELRSRSLIVSGGHGAFEPKKLPKSDFDMTPWENRGVHYIVSEKDIFTDQHVVIIGGGDSAFDWVTNLLDTASKITLVHRRDAFRAHEVTVAKVMEHVQAGRVDIKVPYVVRNAYGNDDINRVVLHHAQDEQAKPVEIECDAVLLQLGFVTKLGPLKTWGFELSKSSIVVDPLMKTTLDQVWACGDIATFEGKLKLIATGFSESAIAVTQAVHSFRPEMKIQPAYSTNTGVPGFVAGQP